MRIPLMSDYPPTKKKEKVAEALGDRNLDDLRDTFVQILAAKLTFQEIAELRAEIERVG